MAKALKVLHSLRCAACNGYWPDRCICNQVKDIKALEVGGAYNWIGQQERLVYLGKPLARASAGWHQFALAESPERCWCEVLPEDMKMLEVTEEKKNEI